MQLSVQGNPLIEELDLPMGIEWRLRAEYSITHVRQLRTFPRLRLSHHGFQISEIAILEDMLHKKGLYMISLTGAEKVALAKYTQGRKGNDVTILHTTET